MMEKNKKKMTFDLLVDIPPFVFKRELNTLA